MIEQVITECLLGALTGYVTNDIALKQLFRDGGIVEKEKDEFIEALIDLLQNEVFTEAQITRILQKNEVKREINLLVEKFFTESVETVFSGVTLKDFPHHQEAKYALVCYLNDQEGEHDSLINLDGIYKNLVALIETGAIGEAVDTMLSHLSTESLKEAIGTSRYKLYIKERIASLFSSSEALIGEKLESIYSRLIQSNLRLADYISLSADEFSEGLIKNLRRFFSEEKFENYITLLKRLKEDENTLFLSSEAFLDKVLAQATDLFLGHFSKKEMKIKALIIDSVREATMDLGEGIQKTLLGVLDDFFAPNWLRRESLSFIKQNKLKNYLMAALPHLKDKGIDYLFSEAFEAKVKCYLNEIWDLPFSEVLGRYARKNSLPSGLKNTVCFGFKNLINFSNERGIFEKIENTPLGLWLLTSKVRIEIKNKVVLFFEHLASGTLDKTIHQLEKEYGWKKSLNTQLVDILGNQDLGKLYHLISSSVDKKAWIASASQKVTLLLQAYLGEMIAKVTRSYLVGLEQKEVRQIVNDLLGKEMRPLSLLGGVIGFFTGFGLGVLNTSETIQEPLVLDLGLRSMTYGAIGYGTNVLAIRSLFRPYKPFLGWQGLLPKNKYRFARQMGYMTEYYIADASVWQTYLAKFEASFDEKLDNGFSYLSKVGLLSGKDNLTLTGAWLNRPLSDFVKDRLRDDSLANLLDDGVKLIVQDERFKLGFESLVKTRIMPHLSENLYHYSEKMGLYLWDTFKDRGVTQLDKGLLVYLDMYFDKGFDFLMNLGESGFLEKTDGLFSQIKLPSSSNFYETLVAQIMRLYSKLLPFIQAYEKTLAKTLILKVKAKLGFRAGMAYRMMSGDRYILRALKIVLYEKLPLFLAEEQEEVKVLLLTYLKNHFRQKSLAELGLSKENLYLQALAKRLFAEREKERLKLGLILQAKEKIIGPLKTLTENTGIFSENFNTYFNLSKLEKEVQSALMPKVEKLLLTLQDEALSYVLTSHVKELFPDWAKNIAHMIGAWEVKTMLNVDRLKHIEAVLNGKGVLPDNRFKLVIETYMYDATKQLLPEASQLLIGQTKSLLQAFDFSSVATHAVDKKDARELELMIGQIANPYFRRVERMGLLGAVVALPSSILSRVIL